MSEEGEELEFPVILIEKIEDSYTGSFIQDEKTTVPIKLFSGITDFKVIEELLEEAVFVNADEKNTKFPRQYVWCPYIKPPTASDIVSIYNELTMEQVSPSTVKIDEEFNYEPEDDEKEIGEVEIKERAPVVDEKELEEKRKQFEIMQAAKLKAIELEEAAAKKASEFLNYLKLK